MKYKILGFTLPLMWAANASAQNIDKCVTLSDASARLACFDTSHKTPSAIRFPQESKPQITAPQSAVTTPQTVVPAVPSAPAVAPNPALSGEQQFGKSVVADKSLKSIISNIKSAQASRSGKMRVTLENGQVWQQLSSDNFKITPARLRRQTSVEIKRGALGSYRLKVLPWGRSTKARRIK